MAEDAESVELLELDLLMEAIYRRYGYDLRGYTLAPMLRRMRSAMHRLGEPSLGALQHTTLSRPDRFADLLPLMTVRVSEMFRHPQCLRAFRERVVPVLKTYPRIRIWHAGCASGEEAYSMAILLHEHGLGDRAELLATDLSHAALDEARAGTYPAERLATFAHNYRLSGGVDDVTRYYTVAYGGFALDEVARRNITWLHHDLVCDGVFAEVQVIFCRNVLLYFGADLRRRVMEKLAASLSPGGFLCLGANERLDGFQRQVGFEDFAPAHRIYRYNR